MLMPSYLPTYHLPTYLYRSLFVCPFKSLYNHHRPRSQNWSCVKQELTNWKWNESSFWYFVKIQSLENSKWQKVLWAKFASKRVPSTLDTQTWDSNAKKRLNTKAAKRRCGLLKLVPSCLNNNTVAIVVVALIQTNKLDMALADATSLN